MPIEPVMIQIYNFIKWYGESHIVKLNNIKLFAKGNGISLQEMGYALKILQDQGRVIYKGNSGWMVR